MPDTTHPEPNAMHEMSDVAFSLQGDHLPLNPENTIWDQLNRLLPWLKTEPRAGLLPLRLSQVADELLVAKRSRLTLRVPSSRLEEVKALSSQVLDIGGHTLQLIEAKVRPLQPFPTLHAHLVASDLDEQDFMQRVTEELAELDIQCKAICGKRGSLGGSGENDDHTISGYSLVLHELKPAASLRLQYAGLGKYRHLGCGIFVPYKVIANLD